MTELKVDSRVRSAMVSDCLDAIGLRNNAMDATVKPLERTMRAVGLASTIKFVPNSSYDPDDPYGAAIDFLDSLLPGQLAVVATGASTLSAFWGELFSAAAKGRGATGVVTDGPLRDTHKILEVGFAAFGAASRPVDYKGRMLVDSIHHTVICGGVEISQGDALIADWDGVVVVPSMHIEKVFAAANERAQSEKRVLAELKAGKSVRAVWDEYRLL
jgi:4-hydroxy-4-methyl-2-oxoglutarate aldolase